MADAVRTPDGHHIVVDGRRWRASDPRIPAPLATELRKELMAARRTVAGALRSGDAGAMSAARHRVDAAKRALGERGAPWWEPADEEAQRARITATIDALLSARPGRTTCPSEVARAAGGDDWRPLMRLVRTVARERAERGELRVTQAGQQVSPPYRGPIRIAPPEP
jgi:hypothetical protein